MSILIKGMEMPKGCLSCFVKAGRCPAIRKRMEEASRSDRWIPENYRHDDCPLVEVPQHGRLIDADFMIKKYEPDINRRIYGGNFIFDLEHAPTIIPADKDGET